MLTGNELLISKTSDRGYVYVPVAKEQKRFGENLRRLREQAKLQSNELARAVKVKPPTMSKWEGLRKPPATATILKLAKALNCSVDDLLQGLDSEYDAVMIGRDLNRQIRDQKLALSQNGDANDTVAARLLEELQQENTELRIALSKVQDVASELVEIATLGGQSHHAAGDRSRRRRSDRKTG